MSKFKNMKKKQIDKCLCIEITMLNQNFSLILSLYVTWCRRTSCSIWEKKKSFGHQGGGFDLRIDGRWKEASIVGWFLTIFVRSWYSSLLPLLRLTNERVDFASWSNSSCSLRASSLSASSCSIFFRSHSRSISRSSSAKIPAPLIGSSELLFCLRSSVKSRLGKRSKGKRRK